MKESWESRSNINIIYSKQDAKHPTVSLEWRFTIYFSKESAQTQSEQDSHNGALWATFVSVVSLLPFHSLSC